jgi:hypothetical protein
VNRGGGVRRTLNSAAEDWWISRHCVGGGTSLKLYLLLLVYGGFVDNNNAPLKI